MARCKSTKKETDLMARMLKAEAVGEGKKGMLLVGNIVVNRVRAKCDVFKGTNSIYRVIYQKNAFSGLNTHLFNTGANGTHKELARKAIRYWQDHPANRALFYNNPGRNRACKKNFYGPFVGKYKKHCFYTIKNFKKCGV